MQDAAVAALIRACMIRSSCRCVASCVAPMSEVHVSVACGSPLSRCVVCGLSLRAFAVAQRCVVGVTGVYCHVNGVCAARR